MKLLKRQIFNSDGSKTIESVDVPEQLQEWFADKNNEKCIDNLSIHHWEDSSKKVLVYRYFNDLGEEIL